VSGVQLLVLGDITLSVERDEEWTTLSLRTAEGNQVTCRGAGGSLDILVEVAMGPEELEALVSLLSGRQIAETKECP
jgi:hypothetical protein